MIALTHAQEVRAGEQDIPRSGERYAQLGSGSI